jgi:transcriptional regulator with XRE-family HTH domain
MNIAAKVQRLMKPYRQDAIAEAAGITANTLRNVMAGRSPTLDTVQRLAGAMGVSFSWLIDDSKKWPPERVRPVTDTRMEQSAA